MGELDTVSTEKLTFGPKRKVQLAGQSHGIYCRHLFGITVSKNKKLSDTDKEKTNRYNYDI